MLRKRDKKTRDTQKLLETESEQEESRPRAPITTEEETVAGGSTAADKTLSYRYTGKKVEFPEMRYKEI